MSENKDIILFDGVCNLCESSVRFIIKHDRKAHFIFASQQSDAGKALMLQFELKKNESESIYLITNNNQYRKSSAVLHIARKLNGLYPLLFIGYLIPVFLRDPMYDFVAKRRYKWFGHKKDCMMPDNQIKDRFIQ